MRNRISNFECTGCECCVSSCPVSAIEMVCENGFDYPVINEERCINCNLCINKCPVNHEYLEAFTCKQFNIEAYVGYYDNEEIRRKSTSGSIAYLLYKMFIERYNGICYGVKFSDTFGVEYGAIEKECEISQFQGSKYLQCRLDGIYSDLENQLRNGRNVLFVGLPCQIEGLRSYLSQEYDNLFLVDLICFGIPSAELWRRYIQDNFSDVREIEFKSKIQSWKKWQVHINTKSEDFYFENGKNEYMNSYLRRYNIRKSCFSCKIKTINRNSDITIGDAWGNPEKENTLNDDKGLSLIIIQSQKGKDLFETIRGELNCMRYDLQNALEGNWAMQRCPEMPSDYDTFWKDYNKLILQDLFVKYGL